VELNFAWRDVAVAAVAAVAAAVFHTASEHAGAPSRHGKNTQATTTKPQHRHRVKRPWFPCGRQALTFQSDPSCSTAILRDALFNSGTVAVIVMVPATLGPPSD
jgi:hypothetical protein